MLRCYYPTVKIATSYSGFGGSTISLAELCDAFNRWGISCLIHGDKGWLFQLTTHARPMEEFAILPQDRVIQHLMELPARPSCHKVILSCHEKNQFNLNKVDHRGYDHIRFVSEDQKNWHGVEGVVIPNLVLGVTKVENPAKGVAGVIGNVSPRKQTHRAICRAIADGYDQVLIYGPGNKDQEYFKRYVQPLLKMPQVKHKGLEPDRNKIYQSVSKVYHCGEDESACRIYAECQKAGIPFNSDFPAYETWEEEKIKESWFALLEL